MEERLERDVSPGGTADDLLSVARREAAELLEAARREARQIVDYAREEVNRVREELLQEAGHLLSEKMVEEVRSEGPAPTPAAGSDTDHRVIRLERPDRRAG